MYEYITADIEISSDDSVREDSHKENSNEDNSDKENSIECVCFLYLKYFK